MSADGGGARFLSPDRSQLQWDLVDLDEWLSDDHAARIVWAFVETLDLSCLYNDIKSRDGHAGRPASDPRVLLALWLLATIEGIGSARELDRLVLRDLAYRWIAGGVPVNYHGLSDFRVCHGAVLDDLLTQSLGALMSEGLIDLEEVLVDGTKVKASAGRNSYKGREDLERLDERIEQHLKALKAEQEGEPGAGHRRRAAARARAARELKERIGKARQKLDQIDQEMKERAKKSPKEARKAAPSQASVTDPDARKMRFADGSFGPGYNIQLATPSRSGLIVAVQATDRRNDSGQAPLVIDQIERRCGQAPSILIGDTGYAVTDDIIKLAARAPHPVTVYAPPPPDKPDAKPASVRAREAKRAREPAVLKAWRARMDSPFGLAAIGRRKRIELTNAHMKNRCLDPIRVRGLKKVQAVVLLQALAHNLITAHQMRTA